MQAQNEKTHSGRLLPRIATRDPDEIPLDNRSD